MEKVGIDFSEITIKEISPIDGSQSNPTVTLS